MRPVRSASVGAYCGALAAEGSVIGSGGAARDAQATATAMHGAVDQDGASLATQPRPGRAPIAARAASIVLWLGLLVVCVVTFWLHERGELAGLGATFAGVAPLWMFAAATTVPLSLVLTVEIHAILLRRFGTPISRAAVWRAHLHRLVAGMAGPLGGPGAIVVFVRSLAGSGIPTDDGLLAVALSNVTGYGSFMFLLLPALALLHLEGHLPTSVLIAAGGLGFAFGLLLLLLWFALRGPVPPSWVLRRLPGRLRLFAHHVRAHDLGFRDFLLPFALAVVVDLVSALTLALCLAGIGQQPRPSEALLATELGALFTVVSPIFQGLGAVELSLTVMFERFGVPSTAALSAILLYRVYTLWLPFLVGLLSVGWQGLAWGVRRARRHLAAISSARRAGTDRSR